MSDVMCNGAGDPETGDHCCWLEGEPCPFLREHVNGRRWSCQLRAELPSWPLVHDDPRYRMVVLPVLERVGCLTLCGDFGPVQKQCCYREVGD